MTRGLAFLRADVSSGGELLMTASGIWRLFPERSATDGARRPDKESGGRRPEEESGARRPAEESGGG